MAYVKYDGNTKFVQFVSIIIYLSLSHFVMLHGWWFGGGFVLLYTNEKKRVVVMGLVFDIPQDGGWMMKSSPRVIRMSSLQ